MPNQDPVNTSSLFSLSEIRERMKEKKNGTLKTTKMNASVAAKIRTKAINNSSIIKATLKQNNKALALALNAAKREVRELTQEKMFLQKEVKLGDFERARLRQKLLSVANLFAWVHHKHHEYIEELQQFMNSQLRALVELSSPSERDSCSLPFDGRLSATDVTDSQADDSCPVQTVPKATRIPVVQEEDDKRENGTRDLASKSQLMLPLQLPTLAVGEPLKNVAHLALENSSSSCLGDEPLANGERNGQPSGEMDGTAWALGGNPSSIPQSSRSCSLSALNNNLEQHSKITGSYSDQMRPSLGHVTERRKRTTGFSALFGDCSWIQPSDNGPLVGLTLAKETEAPEISQMGELVTLKAENKSDKIKGSEAKTPKKMSMGTKGRRSSTSKSKGNSDNCITESESTILKNLTNTAQICHSTLPEESLMRRSTRARKPVSYEEPKLNRKLRRGDPFANSDFFNCPIYKTRKKEITKLEAISRESNSHPIPQSLRKERW